MPHRGGEVVVEDRSWTARQPAATLQGLAGIQAPGKEPQVDLVGAPQVARGPSVPHTSAKAHCGRRENNSFVTPCEGVRCQGSSYPTGPCMTEAWPVPPSQG